MEIALVGISGTGKSTLARKLGKMCGIEPLFTDSYIWEANWTLREKEAAKQDMLAVLQKQDDWIFDGHIAYIGEYVLPRADMVIYLDYSGVSAFVGVWRRKISCPFLLRC